MIKILKREEIRWICAAIMAIFLAVIIGVHLFPSLFSDQRLATILTVFALLLAILEILLAVGGILNGKGFFDRDYIAIMMTGTRLDFPIPKDFEEGFNYADPIEIKGKNPRTVRVETAKHLDEDEAARQIDRYASDKHCLLLITGSNSELTKKSLITLIQKKNSLPIIIPIATDEGIIEKISEYEYKEVLRLLPGNQIQAETIANFIKSKKNEAINLKTKEGKSAAERDMEIKVGIFIDEENTVYSDDLTRRLAKAVRKINEESERGFDGKIVFRNRIGHSYSVRPSRETLKEIDFLIYVGVSHNAVGLADELQEFSDLLTPLIMTDGCLSNETLNRIRKYKGEKYVLSPIKLHLHKQENRIIPSYKAVGRATRSFCEKILSGNEVTRQSLLKKFHALKEHQKTNHTTTKDAWVIEGQAFSFDSDGKVSADDYYIYHITDIQDHEVWPKNN